MVSWRVSKLVAAIDTPKATAVRETIDLLTYYLFKYNIRVIKKLYNISLYWKRHVFIYFKEIDQNGIDKEHRHLYCHFAPNYEEKVSL